MKKLSLRNIFVALLLSLPLILLTGKAVEKARAARRQAPSVPAGFPVPILTEVPKDYVPKFNQGFTVVQIGQARRDTGLIYAATTTILQKADGESLKAIDARDGSALVEWTSANGTRQSWKKGDSVIHRSIVPMQQHTAQELLAAYDRGQKRGVTFAIYKGVLCHTSYDDFEKSLAAPELNNMFLWINRKKYLLETVSLSRGEPDQAQWNSIINRIPTGLSIIDEAQ